MWVVVKIMVPFLGALNVRCRIVIGTQKRDHNFDNHPCGYLQQGGDLPEAHRIAIIMKGTPTKRTPILEIPMQ